MSKLLSAKLKHKITFLEKISKNAFAKEMWQENFSTFAEIKPLNEKHYGYLENFNFGQLVTEALFMFRIRYTTQPLYKLRIQYNNRLFDIKKITNVEEKNLILSIIAIEVT